MARLNAQKLRAPAAKLLSMVNQQGTTSVYLVKREIVNGDPLAFNVGGEQKFTKLKLSPSPFVEDSDVERAQKLGTTYTEGDKVVSFIPPKKASGQTYTAQELVSYDEFWFGPINAEGTPQESPTERLYVGKVRNSIVNGEIVACEWVGRITPKDK